MAIGPFEVVYVERDGMVIGMMCTCSMKDGVYMLRIENNTKAKKINRSGFQCKPMVAQILYTSF